MILTIAFSLDSVEFYVIAALIAAVVIALSIKPSSQGEARQYLLSSTLCFMDDDTPQSLRLNTQADGSILLTRMGLKDITSHGAVSLAIDVVGYNITIKERIVYSPSSGEPIDTALFTLDFLANERYFVRYENEDLGVITTFYYRNRPDMIINKVLV